jgi:F-box protein, helicase, 18
MKPTQEQQQIIDYLKDLDTQNTVLINACAGAGKTQLLTFISDALKPKNALYIAYNKSIATEAATKFPSTVHCMTTHSLAYSATVKPYKLKIGNFTYRSIVEKIPYKDKLSVVALFKEFCLSKHTTVDSFIEEEVLPEKYGVLISNYLKLMTEAKIEASHDFYLKLYHILLATGKVSYPPFDFIALDEAGDLNSVTVEIFKLLPSKIKIAVGDDNQNIYSFNHTVNAFEVLEGKHFSLTESYRVPKSIAPKVERFIQKYLDPNAKFTGVLDAKPVDIKSRAFISRSNSALVDKIINLNMNKVPYGLVRKASEIFKLPIALAGMKYQGKVAPEFSHLQDKFDEWYELSDKKDYASPFAYIINQFPDDIQAVNAIKLISRHSRATIFDAYQEAQKHEKLNQDLILTTAHSCKGLTFDEVYIADDMNNSIESIVELINREPDAIILPEQKESLRLYYVAVTRCTKSLINAQHLG